MLLLLRLTFGQEKAEAQRRDFSYKVILGKKRVSVWKGFLEKGFLSWVVRDEFKVLEGAGGHSWSLESGKWVQNICYSDVLHQNILISPKILSSIWCITIKFTLYPLLTSGKKQMYLDLIFKERHISERTKVTLKLWSVSVNNLKLVYKLKSYWVQMILNFLELNY